MKGERLFRNAVLTGPKGNLTRETMLARHDPEHLLATAIDALAEGSDWQAVLDEIPIPVYVTTADGDVTYWNQACVEFAGREPELGQDRWCITWNLFTTNGEPIAPEDCPMARAIELRQPIRDAIAIAERPDRSRVAFRAYPTPLFEQGELKGAINMLVDITDEQSEALREQAERCRRLADATYDRQTSQALSAMAAGFDRTADQLRQRSR